MGRKLGATWHAEPQQPIPNRTQRMRIDPAHNSTATTATPSRWIILIRRSSDGDRPCQFDPKRSASGTGATTPDFHGQMSIEGLGHHCTRCGRSHNSTAFTSRCCHPSTRSYAARCPRDDRPPGHRDAVPRTRPGSVRGESWSGSDVSGAAQGGRDGGQLAGGAAAEQRAGGWRHRSWRRGPRREAGRGRRGGDLGGEAHQRATLFAWLLPQLSSARRCRRGWRSGSSSTGAALFPTTSLG